jgi:zinc/manganese transport system substrate-binding protein
VKVVVLAVAVLTGGFAALPPARAAASQIDVVAAENFYGDVAQQIGRERVSVTSILSNPDQDPHLFETTASIVRQIAAAQVVVYNGAGYDSWMESLLKATPKPGRVTIVAADLVHKEIGDNPHLWYDPLTMPAVATALADAFAVVDPVHKNGYAARLKTFLASLGPLNQKVASIAAKYAGVPVTATEPVFGYMAAALKLKMRDEAFQLAVMNNTEPSAREFAGFERDLKTRRVRVMFYNTQATDNLVQHLLVLARVSRIPVVGVTETCPPGITYQTWILNELDVTEKALAGPASRVPSTSITR